MKGKIILVAVLLAIIFAGYYVAQNFLKIKTESIKNPITQETENVIKQNITPTQIPLDTNSAQSTLLQTETDIQETLNQLDSDLTAINQINANQDSTTGL